jgi:hypothetical protein
MATRKAAPRKATPKKTAGRKTAGKKTAGKKTAGKKSAGKKAAAKTPGASKLLASGNPQLAKGDGDVPVQAYIAAVPGWKQAVCRRIDALVTQAVPTVRKAVKWNSPFYSMEEKCWFLSFHCFAKYVKVAFFNGAALAPPPPGSSTQKNVRYLDIRENDVLDEAQFIAWVKQASRLPGSRM